LFFLLHANVDRLWAKWQWLKHRFDLTNIDAYSFLGSAGDPNSTRIGHNLMDTMWPWNQITGDLSMQNPRPPTAPGGNFPASKIINFPGLTPAVKDMIDYQGGLNHASRLGFDYDDVPFEFDAL
jgi:tyrosinase